MTERFARTITLYAAGAGREERGVRGEGRLPGANGAERLLQLDAHALVDSCVVTKVAGWPGFSFRLNELNGPLVRLQQALARGPLPR